MLWESYWKLKTTSASQSAATKVVGAAVATKQLQLRTPEEVLCEFRPLIAGVLGIGGDEIIASARFVEDLVSDD